MMNTPSPRGPFGATHPERAVLFVASLILCATVLAFACAGVALADDTPPAESTDRDLVAAVFGEGSWRVGGWAAAAINDEGRGLAYGQFVTGISDAPEDAALWGATPTFLKARTWTVDGQEGGDFTLAYSLGASDSYAILADYQTYPDDDATLGVGYWLPLTWEDSTGAKRKTILLGIYDSTLEEPRIRLEGEYPLPFTSSPENYMLVFDLLWAQEDRRGFAEIRHPMNGTPIFLSVGVFNVGDETIPYLASGSSF